MPRFDLSGEGDSAARHSDCASEVRNRHVDAALRPTSYDKLSLSTGEAGQYGLRHDTLPQLAPGSCHLGGILVELPIATLEASGG